MSVRSMPTITGAVCDPRTVTAWTSRRMSVPARPGFGVSGLVAGDTVLGRDGTPAFTAVPQGPVDPSELVRAPSKSAAAREQERARIERAAAGRRAEVAAAAAGGVRDQSGLLRDMYQYVDRLYAEFAAAAREQWWSVGHASGEICWHEVESEERTAEERLRGALECFVDALFGVGSRAPAGYTQLTEYTLQICADVGAEAAREYACDVLSQLDAGTDCEVGGVLDECGVRLRYMVRNASSLGFEGAARQAGTGRWCGKGRQRRHAMRR
jgi:hypothetical protein